MFQCPHELASIFCKCRISNIYNVECKMSLNKIPSSIGISRKAMSIMNNLYDIIASEISRLAHYNKRAIRKMPVVSTKRAGESGKSKPSYLLIGNGKKKIYSISICNM